MTFRALSSENLPTIGLAASIDHPGYADIIEGGFKQVIHGDLLFLACLALAIIALVALISVFAARREARKAARLARTKSESLRDLLHTMRTAESIAGVGVWQYDHETDSQQWSHGLKRLFGIDGEAEFVEGDVETLLYSNQINLVSSVKEHSSDGEPFVLEFDFRDFDGVPRSLVFHAYNLRCADGSVQRTIAVVRDLTGQDRPGKKKPVSTANEPRNAAPERELDQVTGVASRRTVLRELDWMVMDARAHDNPLALVMFNIDCFHQVTKSYGLGASDEVRRTVAQIAQSIARNTDIIGRVGGQDFVWVIPNTNEGTVRILAERLRQSIAKRSGSDKLPVVTVTAAYATLRDGDSALTLFARADQALREAKQTGRNRVRVAA